jgi:N-acetylmuramoyl-L-alanine amidase
VSRPRLPIRTLLLALAPLTAHAQTQTQPTPTPPAAHKSRPSSPQFPWNPNVVLLDPAHGGSDDGATLAEDSFEKDATIAFADRLKTLLTDRGFTVILTHDSASDTLSPDKRAELANRSHAAACILLHMANGGHGVHLYTSSIAPLASLISSLNETPNEPRAIQPWGTAQAATLPQSLNLAGELTNTIHILRVPLVVGKASIAPIDSITCPAVALELAPLAPASDSADPTLASDPAYQQRIAEAIASALYIWRGQLTAHIDAQIAAKAIMDSAAKPATPPAHKRTPPQSIPIETPGDLTPTPAPIIRRPPPPAPATTPPSGPPQ